MNTIEREIRYQFPGRSNKGIRAELRRAAHPGEGHRVRALARAIALTATGKASLEAVAKVCDETSQV